MEKKLKKIINIPFLYTFYNFDKQDFITFVKLYVEKHEKISTQRDLYENKFYPEPSKLIMKCGWKNSLLFKFIFQKSWRVSAAISRIIIPVPRVV